MNNETFRKLTNCLLLNFLFNSNLQSFYVQKNIVIYLNNSKNSFIAVIFIICNLFSQSGTFKMNILYRTDFFLFQLKLREFFYCNLCASIIDLHGMLHYEMNISYKIRIFVLPNILRIPYLIDLQIFFIELSCINLIDLHGMVHY